MTQSSMSTPYARRLAEKFKESQAYLRANGFSRSTKTLYEDIETSTEKQCIYLNTYLKYNMAMMVCPQLRLV